MFYCGKCDIKSAEGCVKRIVRHKQAIMFLLFSIHNYAIIVSEKGAKHYASYYAY